MSERARKIVALVLGLAAIALIVQSVRAPQAPPKLPARAAKTSPAKAANAAREKKWRAAFSTGARRVISQSRQVTIYALDGKRDGYKGKGAFHGYKVLRAVSLTKAQQAQVRKAFYKGVTEEAASAKCHSPNHALRFFDGKTKLDITVCFQCSNIKIYQGDKESDGWPTISKAPQKTFDSLLK